MPFFWIEFIETGVRQLDGVLPLQVGAMPVPPALGMAERSDYLQNFPRLNQKRVTGFEPATFSLGS